MPPSSAIDRCWPPDLVDLYGNERTAFVRVAYLMTGHLEVAEELVQDAFMACAPRRAELDRPRAYLRTAVVNGAPVLAAKAATPTRAGTAE